MYHLLRYPPLPPLRPFLSTVLKNKKLSRNLGKYEEGNTLSFKQYQVVFYYLFQIGQNSLHSLSCLINSCGKLYLDEHFPDLKLNFEVCKGGWVGGLLVVGLYVYYLALHSSVFLPFSLPFSMISLERSRSPIGRPSHIHSTDERHYLQMCQ
jgi:hypothetical protein